MIRLEVDPEGAVRVIGALDASVVKTLIDASPAGPLKLDLSQVYTAEGDAIRQLAQLPPERCGLVAIPPWLEAWIASERRRLATKSSRIHDEPRASGNAAGPESGPFSVTPSGHGRCDGDPDDKSEETR